MGKRSCPDALNSTSLSGEDNLISILNTAEASVRAKDDQREGNNILPAVNKMMRKMGYQKGKGLGKTESGITEPLSISGILGKFGLGSKRTLKADAHVEWDTTYDPLPPESEIIHEIKTGTKIELSPKLIKLSKNPLDISNETQFIETTLLHQMIDLKTMLDSISQLAVSRAHSRSNPFERIGKQNFINRAALKMADLDHLFKFTDVPANGSTVYFADICSGPGGFTEYLLWRFHEKKVPVKGFGFTLKASCDFQLEKFKMASPLFFEPHYGVNNPDGDGDIYRTENIVSFSEYVMSKTNNEGVDFVVADGGFSVEGSQNIQEIMSKQLYLCQCLMALKILKNGGKFACKLFDVVTPFSVGLVYLMTTAFTKVSIVKPCSSRPANSERYIIFEGKVECDELVEFLQAANDTTNSKKEDNVGILELIPTPLVLEHSAFVESIKASNDKICHNIVKSLAKLIIFSTNEKLADPRQDYLARKLVQDWNLKATMPSSVEDVESRLQELLNTRLVDLKTSRQLYIRSHHDLMSHLRYVENFICGVVSGRHVTLSSIGNDTIYMWPHDENRGWIRLDALYPNLRMDLPRDTLVEGFLTEEYFGQSFASLSRLAAFHIVDCAIVHGVDVTNLVLVKRLGYADCMCQNIKRPVVSRNYCSMRVSVLFSPRHVEDVFSKFKRDKSKEYYNVDTDCWILPTRLLLLRVIRDPWIKCTSRKTGNKYYFNTADNTSVYEFKDWINCDFRLSAGCRLHFGWGLQPPFVGNVTVHDFIKHIKDNS